jgi:hypothetical protein
MASARLLIERCLASVRPLIDYAVFGRYRMARRAARIPAISAKASPRPSGRSAKGKVPEQHRPRILQNAQFARERLAAVGGAS